MPDYIFGANILENLTTGMYQDSKVIYREYIQNACDQIDRATKEGLLKPGEGSINIWLDYDQRTIIIEDNATGIPASLFDKILGNIADSNKIIGEDKGFRGIGRLCGLAYCKELVFKASAVGENTTSIMVCDAQKMRKLIEENVRGKKHTANEVLHAINRFEQQPGADCNSHYFRVELIDINQENTDLLDFKKVKDYLSFVAPVPYQNSFIYRNQLYDHARHLNISIDEYDINLNGETVFKKYSTVLKEASGTKYDDIFGVHFKDFFATNGQLIAWMWFGLSKFQKSIPAANRMRGLRLRKENIQIGNENALQKLFKEERGNNYFIGEVFAIDHDLIPNSQRDYFNENIKRTEFERELRKYFSDELHKIYYGGSAINSAFNKINTYGKRDAEFIKKDMAGGFVDNGHRERELKLVCEAKQEAETAQLRIGRMKDKADNLMHNVIMRIEHEQPEPPINSPHKNNKDIKLIHRTDKLSKYNRSERKLISKIFSIILSSTDVETGERIISVIENELQ